MEIISAYKVETKNLIAIYIVFISPAYAGDNIHQVILKTTTMDNFTEHLNKISYSSVKEAEEAAQKEVFGV